MIPGDTNKVLQELRGLLAIPSHSTVQRMRVAELFDQLDTALSNGQRLPDDWANAIRPMLVGPSVQCHCGENHKLPLCGNPDEVNT